MNRNHLKYRVRDARTERPFELNPFALSSNVSFSCMWLRLGRRVPRRLSNHILNRVRNIGSDMSISQNRFLVREMFPKNRQGSIYKTKRSTTFNAFLMMLRIHTSPSTISQKYNTSPPVNASTNKLTRKRYTCFWGEGST